jgi:hypothetical protein
LKIGGLIGRGAIFVEFFSKYSNIKVSEVAIYRLDLFD